MIDNLSRLALTGTSRQPNAAIRTELPIDPLLDSLGDEPAERRLLLAAGAAALYRSAGQALPSGAPAASAAAAEARPSCSAKIARLLIDLVRAKQVDLGIEAAQLLGQAGRRVPHDILPALLDVADPDLRTALQPILGERGRWLAPFNPDWLWAVSRTDELPASLSDLEAVWNEGALPARVAVLARLHGWQPAQARDWLLQVWPQEKAEPRAQLLAAFASTLTPHDEPLLESILDDRSMAVRSQAARLLLCIAGSRLSGRMIARADAMLTYEPPKAGMLSKLKVLAGSGGGKLLVTPPQEIEVAWERDGIPAKVPQGVGKRAHWLRLVLAMVPLPHWRQRFGVAPDSLLSAAQATEWSDAMMMGWTEAAQIFADADWRDALWQAWLDLMSSRSDAKASMQRSALEAGVPAMLAAMPQREAESCLMVVLKSSLDASHPVFLECFRGLAKPWGAGLAGACLARLRQAAAGKAQRSSALALLPIAARAIPRDFFVQALAPWPQIASEDYADKAWMREIANFIEIVQLRKTLIEETAS